MRLKKCIIKKQVNRILLNNEIATKVYFYFSSKTAGDDFDPYENNYTDTLLNPVVIKMYVREVSPEALVWKQYGLANVGAKEVLCDKKYDSYFRKASRIEIDGEKYQVFKEGTGSRTLISTRPFDQIKVILARYN